MNVHSLEDARQACDRAERAFEKGDLSSFRDSVAKILKCRHLVAGMTNPDEDRARYIGGVILSARMCYKAGFPDLGLRIARRAQAWAGDTKNGGHQEPTRMHEERTKATNALLRWRWKKNWLPS